MSRVDPLQPAFNAGEFGPRMVARSDFAKYRNAARKFENLIALAQGGATRRPGFRFVVPVKDEMAKTRLMPFQFSTIQAYVIEAGDGYFRFCRNQGQILVAETDAAITNGDFVSDISGWTDLSGAGSSVTHDAANGRMNLQSNGVTNAHAEQSVTVGAAFQNAEHVLRFRIFGASGDKTTLQVGTASTASDILAPLELGAGYHAISFTPGAAAFFVQFVNGKGKVLQIDDVALIDDSALELSTSFLTTELFDIRRAQSADVLYLCHAAHPVMKLSRRGHTTWSLTEVDFEDGPYLEVNRENTTLAASVTTGLGITLTASSTTGINDNDGFKSSDVGRLVRKGNGTDWGYAVIVGHISATQVTADVKRDFPSTAAHKDWRLGSWSATTGYPGVVNFHEQRLCCANSPLDPDKYWMSQSGDFENMRPDSDKSGGGVEVQDDDALDYRISSDQVNAIQWIRSARSFAIGTLGGEWLARSDGPVLTPTDVDTKQQTTIGSAFIDPAQVDNAVLFSQRGKRQLREFAFNFEADGFRSPDMTILSDHILRSRVCEVAFAAAPDSLVCCVREDGRIGVLTYKREQDVIGWGRWVLGGSFGSGSPVAESVAVIPGADGTGQVFDSSERDEIWVVVRRTINGSTRRYIEVLEQTFEGPDRNDFLGEAAYETALLAAQTNAFYVDSGVSYSGAATTVVSGLSHLEGETVKILADGAVHADKTVSGGAVTLDFAASEIHIGLGFSHDLEPLKFDVGNPAGSAIAKDKRIRRVSMVLHETGALKIGANRSSIRAESLREVRDLMDTAVPLFTGTFEAEIEGDFEADPRFIIRGDERAELKADVVGRRLDRIDGDIKEGFRNVGDSIARVHGRIDKLLWSVMAALAAVICQIVLRKLGLL